jgi:hypothetical protein
MAQFTDNGHYIIKKPLTSRYNTGHIKNLLNMSPNQEKEPLPNNILGLLDNHSPHVITPRYNCRDKLTCLI